MLVVVSSLVTLAFGHGCACGGSKKKSHTLVASRFGAEPPPPLKRQCQMMSYEAGSQNTPSRPPLGFFWKSALHFPMHGPMACHQGSISSGPTGGGGDCLCPAGMLLPPDLHHLTVGPRLPQKGACLWPSAAAAAAQQAAEFLLGGAPPRGRSP